MLSSPLQSLRLLQPDTHETFCPPEIELGSLQWQALEQQAIVTSASATMPNFDNLKIT